MKNWGVVDQILDFVPTINFDKTGSDISLFETTIRYLGGLVSGKSATDVQIGVNLRQPGHAANRTQAMIS